MIYRDDLKLEFRGVIYGSTGKHILEYRISPDQNLEYVAKKKILFITLNIKKKFSTKWVTVYRFLNFPGAREYPESECYIPVFLDRKDDLEFYKYHFKTVGEYLKYREKEDERERTEYRRERNAYLSNLHTWY